MIARLVASRRGLFHRRRIEDEITEELRDHLEREIEAHRSRGVSPEEARRLALRVVLSVFAGVAVFLAAIGIYGVIAQSVADRRQEIGLRMALGATGGQILRLFLRHGLMAVAVGIACGIGLALAAARSLASLVFGVTVTDPTTLGAVAGLLTAITLLACYLPARSATRVDPLQALRTE